MAESIFSRWPFSALAHILEAKQWRASHAYPVKPAPYLDLMNNRDAAFPRIQADAIAAGDVADNVDEVPPMRSLVEPCLEW